MTQQTKEPISARDTIRQTRMQKLADLADKGINPYPYSFNKTASANELQEKYKDLARREDQLKRYANRHPEVKRNVSSPPTSSSPSTTSPSISNSYKSSNYN